LRINTHNGFFLNYNMQKAMKTIKRSTITSFFPKGAAVVALSVWFAACDNPANRETATEREIEQESAEARGNARDAANDLEKSVKSAGKDLERAGDRAAKDLKKAGDGAGEEIKEEKSEFIAGTRNTMRDLDRRIEQLRGRINHAGKDAKSGMQTELNELEKKRKGLDLQMDKVEKSSENAWQDIKGGLKEAANDVEKAFDRAETKFNRSYDKKE
jgi:BMFP domain-containing protein YqiC